MKKTGFTLIEVVAVLGILGVLALVALPRLSGTIAEYNLQSAARQLLADAQLARQWSITEGRSYIVEFFPDNRFYRIMLDMNNVRLKRNLPNGVSMSHNGSPQKWWMFNNLGEAPSTFSTVTLTASNGKKLYVILASSGRLRISSTP